MKNLLFIGDVVGKTGCSFLASHLHQLKRDLGADIVVVNGENSENGNGVSRSSADSIIKAGADVMTSGKALRESMPKLMSAAKVDVTGMVITVDRQERGTGTMSAVQEVKQEFGVTVFPIVTMSDIIDAIRNDVVPGKEYLDKMLAYREQYGV